jgi:hypothetical protein
MMTAEEIAPQKGMNYGVGKKYSILRPRLRSSASNSAFTPQLLQLTGEADWPSKVEGKFEFNLHALCKLPPISSLNAIAWDKDDLLGFRLGYENVTLPYLGNCAKELSRRFVQTLS